MKYLLLTFCCVFFINDSYAQKRKQKSSKYLTVQGGFFFDGVDKDLDEIFDPNNYGATNYLGFNLFNIKLQSLKDNKLMGIGLKSTYFKKDAKVVLQGSMIQTPGWSYPHYDREKLMFELSVNKGFPLFGTLENGLYVGPSFSMSVANDRYIPITSQIFPITRSYLSLRGGFQVDYFLKLSKKIFLTIGTQASLLDARMGSERINNPILPLRQQRTSIAEVRALVPHFPLLIGFTFSL